MKAPSYWTIRKSITGGWLISMPCPITGRREDAHIGTQCGIEHIHAVARSLASGVTSAQEVAMVAESRMHTALALRAKRHRMQSRKREVMDLLDSGILPSVRQLMSSGML